MAAITHETVFQGTIQVAKRLSPLPKVVQRWQLAKGLAIHPEQVQIFARHVEHSTGRDTYTYEARR